MENLLKWLPSKPQLLIVRYGVTTLLVALSFFLLRLIEARNGVACYFLLYPAVFLAAVMFDRGSGLYAAGLSAVLLGALKQLESGTIPQRYWLPFGLFLIVGLILAALSEALRSGWERAAEAERTKDLLYRELGHRTKNDLAMAASVLMMQARAQSSPEAQAALTSAVGRLHALSKVHAQFDQTAGGEGVQMREYLEVLCQHLDDSMSSTDEVSVRVDCEGIEFPTARAVPIGLIVNELVTNAYKHAFADGRKGVIVVSLHRQEDLVLAVEDNGRGCPDNAPNRLGSQLVHLLVRQLKGKMARTKVEPGCRVQISFPE